MKKYYLNPSPNASLPQTFGQSLNPQQYNAMMFNQGPLLLIAGAGSGKTNTLVHRVARLVYEGVPPNQILLLTFTRKAAQEMLNRAAKLLDDRCHHVSGGTFHSFANTILRQFSEHIGYPNNFTIMDRSDSEDLIQQIRKSYQLKQTNRFPKKSTLATIISKQTNQSQSIAQIIIKDFPQLTELTPIIEQLSLDYTEQKQAMHIMDYDDLLIKLHHLLRGSPQALEQIQQNYHYIMVDEYQDTNQLQSEIVYALAQAHQNIMVVGDDAQSIYSFRGANFKNMMQFPTQYPNATIIKLEENYRSTQPILTLTNHLISYAKQQFNKQLFTTKDGTQKPIYIETPNENTQSRFICQRILELREQGIPLNEIAVLMRSGWHSNDLEIELKSHEIPFTKYGGFKFVEAAHVKDVLAILRLIYNPSDQLSWQRTLLLFDGLGLSTATKLFTTIQSYLNTPQQFPFHHYQTKRFFHDFSQLHQLVFSTTHPTTSISEIVKKVLAFYQPLFQLTYDNYTKRQSDLDSFSVISERFQTLEELLSEMTLDPPTEVHTLPQQHEDEPPITLSTIHSAKGLEWHAVFMMSCVDGYIPSFQSLGDINQIEEERRLLYVALTRAKENLFILKPNLDLSKSNYYRYSGIQFSKLSRFLYDHDIINTFAEKWILEENAPQQFDASKSDDNDTVNDIDTPKETSRRKYYF